MDSITPDWLPSTQWYCSAISGYIGIPENTEPLEVSLKNGSGPIESKGSMENVGFNEVQWLQ